MLLEAEALERLQDGKFSFAPLELRQLRSPPRLPGGLIPDWILVLAWEDAVRTFAVEYKSVSTPKRLRDAIAQAKAYAAASDVKPMIMTPYLDEGTLDLLAEEAVSGIDFSGNGVVVVPGSWLVYRSGKPNAYPASQYIKAIYSGRSSLVGRTLLVRQRFDKVSAVRDEIERRGGSISLPTVSKVLKSLEEELIVGREEGVVLLQPDRLLAGLVDAFRSPAVRRRGSYRCEDLPTAMGQLMETAEREGVQMAARGERAFTLFPGSERSLTVYTDDSGPLGEAIGLEETRRFSNLELLETRDETVYFDRRLRDGFFWTSPVQTYLELANGGKRERDIAEQLRAGLLTGELGGPAS